MRCLILTMIVVLLVEGPALAQGRPATAARRAQAAKRFVVPYYQIGARFVLSQEGIGADRGSGKETLMMQFQGTQISGTYKKPFSNVRWVQSHSVDVGFGNTKGKGNPNSSVPDALTQPYYSLSFSPGIIYRTEPPTEIGLSLPLTYRMIQWRLEDPSLQMEKASSFAFGLSLTFGNRLTANSTLFAAFTHQINLQSTVWALGFDYAFR